MLGRIFRNSVRGLAYTHSIARLNKTQLIVGETCLKAIVHEVLLPPARPSASLHSPAPTPKQ